MTTISVAHRVVGPAVAPCLAGPMLSWLVETKQIEPHIPVWDKTERTDGTISSGEFIWDEAADEYRCSLGRPLRREWRAYSNPRTHITKAETIICRSRAADCAGCPLKSRCCPNMPFRKIARSVYEAARNTARAVAKTSRYRRSRRERKKVEVLFAHLKRILRLDRLRLRGPNGARDEFLLAATAQNLRRMARYLGIPPPSQVSQPLSRRRKAAKERRTTKTQPNRTHPAPQSSFSTRSIDPIRSPSFSTE